jgi:hypothetical protein
MNKNAFLKNAMFTMVLLCNITLFAQLGPEDTKDWTALEEAEFHFDVSYSAVKSSPTSKATILTNAFNDDEQPEGIININQETKDDSWVLDTTLNNVVFYHKLVSCGDKKAVLLKFENRNNFNVEISWKEIIGSKQEPNPNDEFSTTNTLIIQLGITQPIDCSDTTNAALVVLPVEVSPMFIADIESFSFSSITVKELN